MEDQEVGRLADATGLAGAAAPEPDKPSRPDGGIPSAEPVFYREDRIREALGIALNGAIDIGGQDAKAFAWDVNCLFFAALER